MACEPRAGQRMRGPLCAVMYVAIPINGGTNRQMRFPVLGAGLQGPACAHDLLPQPDVERLTLADLS